MSRSGRTSSIVLCVVSASAFTVVELDVAELDQRPDGIREIFDGELLAIIVKNVFPPAILAAAVERIGRGDVRLPELHVPVFAGPIYGRPLVTSAGNLTGYLDDAERFRASCAALFGEHPTVDERIRTVFEKLAGGRAVDVPREQGRPFTMATLRVLLEGDRLPLHFENSTFDNPVMRRFDGVLDRRTLMSFYVPVSLPGGGGELRIFDMDEGGEGRALIHRMGSEDAARPLFEAKRNKVLRPGVGDMLIFDGGRYYHEVTRVEGRPRWTLGGFFALSSDHRSIQFWS